MQSYKGKKKIGASHYISVMEQKHFNLAACEDDIDNYRNVAPETNKNKYTRIDNYLVGQNKNTVVNGVSIKYEKNRDTKTISKLVIKQRIEKKVEVAKSTGWIKNERFNKYLCKICAAYGISVNW